MQHFPDLFDHGTSTLVFLFPPEEYILALISAGKAETWKMWEPGRIGSGIERAVESEIRKGGGG